MGKDKEEARAHWINEALALYEIPLLRYAVSILGDVDRARDVVQDTFLKLCRQDSRTLGDHIAPWLFRVCRNRALDIQRKEGRMNRQSVDSEMLRDPVPGPMAALESREYRSLLNKLLLELSDNQREVVRLKFQNGLSYREISDVTGLSVSNVGFLIHTAIKSLRGKFKAIQSHDRIRRVK